MNAKRFKIILQEQSFEVEVLDDPRQQEVRVRVNGKVWPLKVEDLTPVTVPEPVCTMQPAVPGSTPSSIPPVRPQTPGGEDKARQATIIRAPLPGVIAAIHVQAEQPVRCGQDICSIETMKMNNVIQAPVAGAVGRIFICQGQAVNFDEPLVEILP